MSNLPRLVLLAGAALFIALFAGLLFGAAVWLWVSGDAIYPGLPVPACPSDSSLYTRTVAEGRLLVPEQHCFRDQDATDPTPAP